MVFISESVGKYMTKTKINKTKECTILSYSRFCLRILNIEPAELKDSPEGFVLYGYVHYCKIGVKELLLVKVVQMLLFLIKSHGNKKVQVVHVQDLLVLHYGEVVVLFLVHNHEHEHLKSIKEVKTKCFK